jgi:2,3-bisphosphoglycerate-independent phosphoglycerate mutase
VVCDHGEGVQGQPFYAFGEGPGKSSVTAGRRFTEQDAQAATSPARDATKFVTKFFSTR